MKTAILLPIALLSVSLSLFAAAPGNPALDRSYKTRPATARQTRTVTPKQTRTKPQTYQQHWNYPPQQQPWTYPQAQQPWAYPPPPGPRHHPSSPWDNPPPPPQHHPWSQAYPPAPPPPPPSHVSVNRGWTVVADNVSGGSAKEVLFGASAKECKIEITQGRVGINTIVLRRGPKKQSIPISAAFQAGATYSVPIDRDVTGLRISDNSGGRYRVLIR